MSTSRAIFLSLIALPLVVIGVAVAPRLTRGYVSPVDPLGGNIIAPLNSGSATQHTFGSLVVGDAGKSSVLCLNAAYDSANPLATTDTANCISDWSEVGSGVGTGFVRLSATGINCDPNDDANYQDCYDPARYGALQSGYVHIAATDAQAYATLVESPELCVIDPGDTEGQCLNDSKICRQNTDCLPSSAASANRPFNTALYATNGGVSSNFAGYFSGRFLVNGSLCLNGYGAGSCITQWSQITSIGSQKYLKLQAPTAPATIQAGAISVAGTGYAGGAMVGPSSVGPLCGDGFCSTAESCTVDCESINQLQSFTASSNVPNIQGKIRLTFRTSSQSALSAGGTVQVLIVRSEDPNFVFSPEKGSQYTAPTGDSNYAVVVAQSILPNKNTIVDDLIGSAGLAAETPYYYRAYQGNAFPRWGTPRTAIGLASLSIVQPGN